MDEIIKDFKREPIRSLIALPFFIAVLPFMVGNAFMEAWLERFAWFRGMRYETDKAMLAFVLTWPLWIVVVAVIARVVE